MARQKETRRYVLYKVFIFIENIHQLQLSSHTGFAIQFSSLTSSVYTLLICIVFYVTIVRKKRVNKLWEAALISIAWIPSLFLAIIPVAIPNVEYSNAGMYVVRVVLCALCCVLCELCALCAL